MYACNTCNFVGKDSNNLKEHERMKHASKNVNKNVNKNSEMKDEKQRKPQYCHYWNNFGTCNFELKNGRPFKFEHISAPRCNFDGNCNRKCCMYVHKNQNMSFLANVPMSLPPHLHLRATRRDQHQRNNQFPRQNQHGSTRRPMWENQRHF